MEYLMQRGEADRALPVLRRPGASQELWYKFAPSLMLLAPAQTVDAWMTAQPPLDPPRYVCSLWLHPPFPPESTPLPFCQPPSPVPSHTLHPSHFAPALFPAIPPSPVASLLCFFSLSPLRHSAIPVCWNISFFNICAPSCMEEMVALACMVPEVQPAITPPPPPRAPCLP